MSPVQTQRALAPAKVNISLRIVGRRADGYHLLDSLMVPVALYDELEVAVRCDRGPEITLACDSPDVPGGRANLAYRAAELFLQQTGRVAQVHIRLTKRIPAGSGLGGGSSDAAAVFSVLNRLLDARSPVGDLAAWGTRLGADVPFFVHGRPARVEGIGEIVTPVDGWGGIPLVIAFPGVGLSTAAIYARYDAAQGAPGCSLTNRPLATSIANFASSRTRLRELLVNDLEAVAAEVHSGVLSLKRLFVQLGAEGALMTGSGSAVFGIWPTRIAAEAAASAVRNQGRWAVAAATLDASSAAV